MKDSGAGRVGKGQKKSRWLTGFSLFHEFFSCEQNIILDAFEESVLFAAVELMGNVPDVIEQHKKPNVVFCFERVPVAVAVD